MSQRKSKRNASPDGAASSQPPVSAARPEGQHAGVPVLVLGVGGQGGALAMGLEPPGPADAVQFRWIDGVLTLYGGTPDGEDLMVNDPPADEYAWADPVTARLLANRESLLGLFEGRRAVVIVVALSVEGDVILATFLAAMARRSGAVVAAVAVEPLPLDALWSGPVGAGSRLGLLHINAHATHIVSGGAIAASLGTGTPADQANDWLMRSARRAIRTALDFVRQAPTFA